MLAKKIVGITGFLDFFRRPIFLTLEYRTMEKVQKPSNSECYTPSSEPFRKKIMFILNAVYSVLRKSKCLKVC
jgi:hypothetical protein